MSRPPLALVPTFFGCLVFDHRTSRYMPFDRECAGLLDALCDAPVDALVAAADGDARRDHIIALYRRLFAAGFFLPDGRLAAQRVALDPPADHLAAPLALHLEIVAACNLRCTHCFAGALPRKGELLSVAEIDDLFGDLARTGCFRVGLTGGEPLLRRDLFDIIDAATARGLHPCLTTNALLLDEPTARELGRRPLCWLNVSLEGASARHNDAVRGAGTFARVRDKLRLLARHARFTVAFTITRQNADEVVRCAELAREVGAHSAVFRPLYPVGIARAHLEQLMPTYPQYADALAQLAAACDGGRLGGGGGADEALHTIDPFSPTSRATRQARTFVGDGCGAANLVASISAHGDVSPCSFLGAAFECGNIRERPFSDIWRDGQTFAALRRAGRGPAARADDAFRGGCRARALVLAGDADAADPWQHAYETRQRSTAPGTTLQLDADGATGAP